MSLTHLSNKYFKDFEIVYVEILYISVTVQYNSLNSCDFCHNSYSRVMKHNINKSSTYLLIVLCVSFQYSICSEGFFFGKL